MEKATKKLSSGAEGRQHRNQTLSEPGCEIMRIRAIRTEIGST